MTCAANTTVCGRSSVSSCSLHEKRYNPEYQFMQVVHEGNEKIYRIDWKDVVTLLESPVIKKLRIK